LRKSRDRGVRRECSMRSHGCRSIFVLQNENRSTRICLFAALSWMSLGTLACAILSTLMVVVFPAVTKFIMLTSPRGEAGDDRLEAAVAAERLPQGMQTQVSVT